MGTTDRYLATVEEASTVLDWFRALPIESVRDSGALFYFRDFGPLNSNAKKSPMVSVFLPVRKCGVLTTIGEVHFLPARLSTYPGLNKINKRFRAWLAKHPCVFSRRPDFVSEWDYFLEGGIRSFDPDVFALPAGMEALQRGAYFVSADDNQTALDRVCRALGLRGVVGVRPRST